MISPEHAVTMAKRLAPAAMIVDSLALAGRVLSRSDERAFGLTVDEYGLHGSFPY